MGGKVKRSKERSTTQKNKSDRNIITKYEKLITENPNDKHVPQWKAKINKAKGVEA
jgi:hypothetical protein